MRPMLITLMKILEYAPRAHILLADQLRMNPQPRVETHYLLMMLGLAGSENYPEVQTYRVKSTRRGRNADVSKPGAY